MHRHKATEPCELSEAQAIRLAQRGNPAAFERLYQLHSPRVYALCLRMLRNTDDAEDSTQDVFLHVFRKIQGFRGDAAFSTWLHRVAVNTVLMRFRGSKEPKTATLDDSDSNRESGAASREAGAPDPRLEGYVDRVAIEKAIAELPPRCKLMFVLYDIQGYAHREIARIAGCSVGNAKSQLHKARVRLRQLLLRDVAGAEKNTPRQTCLGGARFHGHQEPCESL